MEMNEIYNCCHFIYERLEKEIDIIDVDFYSPKMENIERYKDLLFFKFKELLLLEGDTILKDEYLYIIKRIIIAFKDLKEFQKIKFNLEAKHDIEYKKFYKDIFEIICYITNLFPFEDYKYELQSIYPKYISYKRLQNLLPVELINNKNELEIQIQSKEIIDMFRCFLLFILYRSFFFIYYNINEFIQVFLEGEFRHDKYIGLIAQQKLDLLYDIVHKPNLNKILSNYWFDTQIQDKEILKFQNIQDILNFGLFLKEINDEFIIYNESYNMKYCLVYFFLLFNYEEFHFLENKNISASYQNNYLYLFLNEIIAEELMTEDRDKKLNQMLTYKLFNFVHGKNFCSMIPTIYLEKFLVDILIKKVENDKDLNFPKSPLLYYSNRLKKYNNIKIIVESFRIDWNDKNKLLELIKGKLKANLNNLNNSKINNM
jgi:hypothetical protein